MSNEFFGDGLTIHTIDTSTIRKLGAITTAGIPINSQTAGDEDGRDFDYSRFLISQLTELEFTTKSVAALMAVLPINGICLRTDGTHPGVTLYGRQRETCGPNSVAVGASDHMAFLFDTGLLVPETLSAGRGQDTTVSARIHALTDGTNAPFAWDPAVALPTGLDSSKFALGHMRVGNILFDDIRNLNAAFNVTIGEKLPAFGSVWADSVPAGKATPVVSLEGRNPQRLNDAGGSSGIPLLGKQAAHTDTIFYFKKRSASGFVADGTAEHFSMTVSGLLVWDNPFAFSGNSPAATSFRIEGLHDGTNVDIVFTTGIAYDPTPLRLRRGGRGWGDGGWKERAKP